MMMAVKGLAMEKWFCWGAMGVGGLVLLLFLLDVIIDKPFGLSNIGLAVDILGILCCALSSISAGTPTAIFGRRTTKPAGGARWVGEKHRRSAFCRKAGLLYLLAPA